MRLKYKICMLLFAGIGTAHAAFSQYKLEQPIHVGMEEDLPTRDVRSIRKGEDGFIWMGTAEGLGRFDGQQVKMYNLADEQQGLFSGVVNAVLPFEKEVWAGSNQGIVVLNKTNESFRFYQL